MKILNYIFNYKSTYHTTNDGVTFLLRRTYNVLSIIKIKIYKFPYCNQIDCMITFPFRYLDLDLTFNKYKQ